MNTPPTCPLHSPPATTERQIGMRPELGPLPRRMQGLPLDKRGFPVPWFVGQVDGEPDFRVVDGHKFVKALKERRCWICGEPLGVFVSFVSGPMCGMNRTSAEPPSHRECAQWSARNCPFLTLRQVQRREDDVINAQTCPAPGLGLKHNPGVCLVWTTKEYWPFRVPRSEGSGNAGVLVQMGEPTSVEFYHRGRPATREEIDAAVVKGFPRLEELAATQAGAMPELLAQRTRFEALLPSQANQPPPAA